MGHNTHLTPSGCSFSILVPAPPPPPLLLSSMRLASNGIIDVAVTQPHLFSHNLPSHISDPRLPTPTPLRPRFLDISMSIEQRFRGSMAGQYQEGTMTMAQAAVLMERSGPSGPSVLSRLGSSLGKIQIGFEWHSV